MTAATFLADLRRRGVQVVADGSRLRCRAPAGTLTPSLVETLRERKSELLGVLRTGADPVLLDAELVQTREQVCAVLLDSPSFGQVWIALSTDMLSELIAEERDRDHPRPVLRAEDAAKLVGRSDPMKRALLEAITAFPGSRPIQ